MKSIGELVKAAKDKPGGLNYSSAGHGHFHVPGGEMFKGQAGVNIVHVPYRGGGAALSAVISEEAPRLSRCQPTHERKQAWPSTMRG